MKRNGKFLKSILVLSMSFSTIASTVIMLNPQVYAAQKEESYTQYVDPFVCTDVDYGQLFPGSVVPNGLVKLSPDTYPHDTLDHAGYDYSKLQIQGFSHTRIEGVGGQGAGGDVLVTPTYVQYTTRPKAESKAMNYSKDDESAKPGYYSVEMIPKTGTDNNTKSDESMGKIHAEMTTDQRTGMHSYTFPKAGNINILTDLNYTYHGTDIRNATLDILEQNDKTTAIGGKFSGRNVGGNGKYTMYFYMETSKPAKNVKTWNGNKLSDEKSQKGNDLGAILNFDVKENEQLQLKVSISPISVNQAKIDMHNEINDWDFDEVKNDADKAWNDVLGKVRIESSKTSDPTGDLKKLFYTHLYHMFMTPVNATSTSGTFRGTDGKIHEAKDYTHYDSWTLWDDYRKYPMIGLIQPDTYKDMVKSIADALDYGIVTWSHDKQPVPNVRTEHAVALLADGVAKGFTDIDNLEEAYEEAKKISDKVITDEVEEIGYVPNRVDQTAEYAYDDWCLSIIAKALGKNEESDYYLKRSMNYKNTFRKDAVQSPFSSHKLGLLWNKDKNGQWLNQDPTSTNTGLYQGTMWQYTWYDSNDVNGLIELMGGKDIALEALMYMFGMQDENNPNGMQHNAANEVELHTPYLFNFVGRPDLTQHWIREIYTRKTWNSNYASGTQKEKQQMYKLSPQGYLETMDDDAGTMAMMFVSAAMGIYPMTPGDSTFQIGSPFFEKMSLDVGNGKTFTIEAKNVSDQNEYIQSATFNGQAFNRTWLDYSEMTRGGVLSLEMGNQPSDWAKDGVTASSSSDSISTSYGDDDPLQYSSSTFVESHTNDGSIESSILLTVNDSEFTGQVGDNLVADGKVKIENVPKGLTPSVIKKDKTTLEIKFFGQAKNHTLNDSQSNVKITVNDNAFTVPIKSNKKVKDNFRIMFENDQLSYSKMKLSEVSVDDGMISDTTTITLNGSSTFTGDDNENYVETKKVSLQNVPEGLTPVVKKTSDKTAVLSFTGKAVNHDYDQDIAIEFHDEAFAGQKANEIKNSSLFGMTAFVLDFKKDYSAQLSSIIEKAEKLNKDDYEKKSYQTLMDSVSQAKKYLESGENNQTTIQNYISDIEYAMEQLKPFVPLDATIRLEAEKSDNWSGNGLKNETINLGGTYDGAWIEYDALNFDSVDVKEIEVRYDTPTGRCASDGILEVRSDAVDGQLLAKVELKPTGSGWGTYETVKVQSQEIDNLTGIHDIYFVMHGTTDSAHPYIGNFDYMQFNELKTSVKIEAESKSNWSGGSLKIENSTDADGNTLTNIGATYPGAWLKYDQINFNKFDLSTIDIRYVNNSNRCKPDSRLVFRLDNLNNEPFAIIDIPTTGDNWNAYQIISQGIEANITGIHDIYVSMEANEGGNPYVCNLDWISLSGNIMIDKSQLKLSYDKALEMIANGDIYEEIGLTRLKEYIKVVETIMNDTKVTQSEVNEVNDSLNKLMDTMTFKIEDDIDVLVYELDKIEGDYSKDSYIQLKKAIEVAKGIPNGSEYSVYKEAYDQLIKAKSELTLLNRNILQNTIKQMDGVDLDLYKAVGKTQFKNDLEKAKTIVNQKWINQEDLDKMVDKLMFSYNSLELLPVKTELEQMISEIEGLDKNQYTQTSWNKMQEVLMDAKKLSQNENATQEEIDEMVKLLKDVKSQLEFINNENNDTDSSQDENTQTPGQDDDQDDITIDVDEDNNQVVKPDTGDSNMDKDNQEVQSDKTKTSDETKLGLICIVGLASMIGFMYTLRKKEKEI